MNKSIAAPLRLILAALWISIFVLSEPSAGHAQEQYTLTVNVEGQGEVIGQPPGNSFSANQTVQLTAVAATGWGFVGWQGDLADAANPAIVTMSGNKSVTATFSQYEYTLMINVSGGGSISLNATAPYYYGQQVGLTAVAQPGWTFSEWSGGFSGSANPLNLTVVANQTLNALFVKSAYQLTVNTTGSGNVTRAPDKPLYEYGDQVQLTASPASGFIFAGWGHDLTGNASPAAVTIDGSKSVTASFVPAPTAPIGASAPANGGSSPPGGGLAVPAGGGGVFQSQRTYFVDDIDVTGAFIREASARSDDGFVKLTIPRGVTSKTAQGVNISFVELYPVKGDEAVPPAPVGGSIAGNCYRLDHEGTTFDPGVTLTMLYSQATVPTGVKENDLVIGYYSPADHKWTILPDSKVDTEGNAITATLRTLGTYAVLGFLPRPVPPDFSLGPPVILPIAPVAGEDYTVSTVVANRGSTGTYSVTLFVNGILIGTRDLVLAPDQDQVVDFKVHADSPGVYNLDLNGRIIPLTVKPSETPQTPLTSARPTTSTSLTTSSTTNLPTETRASTLQPSTSSTVASSTLVISSTESMTPAATTISAPVSPAPSTDTRAAFPVGWLVASAVAVFVLVLAVTLIRGRGHS